MLFGNAVQYVPSSPQKKLDKGFLLDADTILFDLEDSVGANNKSEARAALSLALASRATGKGCFAVRINGIQSVYFEEDVGMISAPGVRLDAVVLPNANAHAVTELCKRLDGANSPLRVMPLIETAEGVETAVLIAGVSKRIAGLMFGAEDYTKNIGVRRTAEGAEIFYARCKLINAAHMHGLEAIDTPCTNLEDDEVLRRDAEFARSVGFTGKSSIHPKHIETIRKAFRPSAGEIAEAERILDALARLPEDKRNDAFSLDGKMIDIPIVDRARNLLERAGRE